MRGAFVSQSREKLAQAATNRAPVIGYQAPRLTLFVLDQSPIYAAFLPR